MAVSTEAPSFPNWTMEIMLALCRILGRLNAQMVIKCLGQPQACRISGNRESPPALLALTSHHSEASRHNPHLIPWQDQGGRPLPEEDVGSSSPVGPSPSQATQSAHVSASGASGCERSPRKGQAGGKVVSVRGLLLPGAHPQETPLTSEKCPKGLGRRACCAPGACPSPRRQSTGRSQGRRCTCSGSPPPAHYNHHRSHWGVPCFGAPPEHTGGGDPSGTPSSLQGGWRAGDSVSHEESALGGRQSEGPQCHPSDTESTRIQLLN